MVSYLKNDLLLRALLQQPTPRTPVWIMQQAGRYLPEYKKTREKAGSFLKLAKNPDLATEVTLQPIQRFKLDAAIVFSDILTIPDAMGLGLNFVEGEGPSFERPLRDEKSILSLSPPDPSEKLRYVIDTIRQLRQALDNQLPLIGFSGSPFTLACYQIEGRGGSDFHWVKKMLYQRPKLLHRLLEINTKSVIDYLNAQIVAGANAVILFDTWGGILSQDSYKHFSLEYIKRVLKGVIPSFDGQKIPKTVFSKGGAVWLDMLARSGADAIGIDWQLDIGLARKLANNRVALQGNLDPSVLFGTPELVQSEVGKVLKSYGRGNGHVFNLGHGISQFTPPENVEVLIEAVRNKSPIFH